MTTIASPSMATGLVNSTEPKDVPSRGMFTPSTCIVLPNAPEPGPRPPKLSSILLDMPEARAPMTTGGSPHSAR